MIDQVLQKLIEFLENASPLVWNTLIKQVYVEAFSTIAWAILLIFFCIAALVVAQKLKIEGDKEITKGRYDEDNNPYFGMVWASRLASLILGIVSFSFVITAIQYIINPEYYAIQMIIKSISGGS